MLIGVIGAAVVVVAALAVLTPTVIVDDDDGARVGLVAAVAPPEIAPALPGGPQGVPRLRRQPFGDLRGCLEKQGLGRLDRSSAPDLRTLRKALKACRDTLPGPRFGG
jgi:hypothetical protein